MAQDKITDLRHHLFAALERLGDDQTMKNPVQLEKEIKRAKAIVDLSNAITETVKVEVSFMKTINQADGKIDTGTGFFGGQKQIGAK